MVSKPTGRARGRPRKPAKPKLQRGVGRPKFDFRRNRYRHAVALLDAMLALDMPVARRGKRLVASERACAKAVAVWLVGVEGDAERLPPDHRHVVTNWDPNQTLRGATAATLDGCAASLREIRRRYCSLGEAAWRRCMASAFMIVLGARDREHCKAAVLERCQRIGEDEFARTVLWPMIDAKIDAKNPARFSG
jgi:hypothetical protein